MSMLGERLLAIHTALAGAGVTHAYGGAIALAYCTGEPRATIDLDINVFLPSAAAGPALAALPAEVDLTDRNRAEIDRDGQTRAWWGGTPVDLFFNTHPFHDVAAVRVHEVPFGAGTIPVLDATTLAVFKVFFNRTKDWADLEAMADAGQLDVTAVAAFVVDLLGPDEARLERLAALDSEIRGRAEVNLAPRPSGGTLNRPRSQATEQPKGPDAATGLMPSDEYDWCALPDRERIEVASMEFWLRRHGPSTRSRILSRRRSM